MSVSVDRVAVPMEEPAPKEERVDWKALGVSEETTRKHGRELAPRDQAVLEEAERVASGPRPKIQRNYRMAYCATVTLHDSHGDALHTIRYGRMPAAVDSLEQLTHREVHRMMERLRQDVLTIRERIGPVPVVLLADGDPELWKLFARHFDERSLGGGADQVDRRLARARIRGRPRVCSRAGRRSGPGRSTSGDPGCFTMPGNRRCSGS